MFIYLLLFRPIIFYLGPFLVIFYLDPLLIIIFYLDPFRETFWDPLSAVLSDVIECHLLCCDTHPCPLPPLIIRGVQILLPS